MGIAIFGLSTSLQAWGQCGDPVPSFDGLTVLKRDTASILNLFNNITVESSATVVSQDNLIVPGKRVGAIHLGMTLPQVSELLTLKPKGQMQNPEYRWILPLGYSPQRLVYESPSEKLSFAFSRTDQVLREIMISSSHYQTAEGIKQGDSLSTLQTFFSGELRTHGNTAYWVSDRITFTVQSQTITRITIF